MNTLHDALQSYQQWFKTLTFPENPARLYDAIRYFLDGGGKRIRPVLCLLGNEMFGELHDDAFHAATAVELYHNFSLVHDDIIDHSPLRRGRPTVHIKYNTPTAILAGDVLLINAFGHINHIRDPYREQVAELFSATAVEVCEGQQLDIDMEETDAERISYTDYLHMITLKTSVLLAASIKMGAIVGGASTEDQSYIYDFGKNLGVAFQMQDDYLDAFGDPEKTGKQPGGDILENKKTALLVKTMERASPEQKTALKAAMQLEGAEKVAAVLAVYEDCKVDKWALATINQFTELAFNYLNVINVPEDRKASLLSLADALLVRQS